MERRWVRVLLWVSVIAVCGMIFFFSAQDGEASSEASGKVVRWMIAAFYAGYDSLAAAEQQIVFETASVIVRKCAHFAEFALLGFFVCMLTRSYRLRRYGLWAWVAGSLYAVTDEVHQLFSTARNAAVLDVLVDSAGVLAGVWFAWMVMLCWRRWRGRKAAA